MTIVLVLYRSYTKENVKRDPSNYGMSIQIDYYMFLVYLIKL